jgi:hypothetical protein
VSRRSWAALLGGLAGLATVLGPVPAPGQTPEKKAQPPAKADEAAKKDGGDDQEKAPQAPDVPGAPVADPSQTRRVAPVEVFKDESVEGILGLDKLKPLVGVPPVNPTDILKVKEMAGNPNITPNTDLINQVVRGLAAQLTDRKSIQSLLEEPEEEPAGNGNAPKKGAPPPKAAPKGGDAGHAIQVTTSNLLDPIFTAQGAKNEGFLKEYRRSLQANLKPLLTNHLVPRVQAMIVLGVAANPTPDGLKLFRDEIANAKQALWVKLWALEGISNIKKGGAPFTTDEESRTGRAIAEFLRGKDLPWPIAMRGLQALGWLRQATLPTDRQSAPMANVAMSYLVDPAVKLEVRAEAARALGLLQTGGIPRYNYKLVAAAAGRLIADLGSEINDLYSDSPPRAENPTRATFLLVLLIGPAYEAFGGVDGQSNSGLLRTASTDNETSKYVREIFDRIKPIAQSAINLRGAPTKEYKRLKQELAAGVADLRDFLQKSPPASQRLVPGGPQFEAAGALNPPPTQPVAQARRGR